MSGVAEGASAFRGIPLPDASIRADRDRVLLARVDALDGDALGALYDLHAPRLLGLARRILGQGGEAEEVLQEVFLFVWRAASSFDAARGNVLTWLFMATRSRSIDRVRSRRSIARFETRSLEELVDEPPSPLDLETACVVRQREALCRTAVRRLPSPQRRALELAYFEGLTQLEIARAMATPVGTVKTRLRLGLRKVRESVRAHPSPIHRPRPLRSIESND